MGGSDAVLNSKDYRNFCQLMSLEYLRGTRECEAKLGYSICHLINARGGIASVRGPGRAAAGSPYAGRGVQTR